VPASATVAGLPAALCVIASVALTAAAAVGANVTLTVHDWPLARLAPTQLPAVANAPLFAATALIDSVPPPALLTVTDCAALVVPTCWLPKATDVRDSAIAGVLSTPVPLKLSVTLPPELFDAIVSVALRAPSAAGVNV